MTISPCDLDVADVLLPHLDGVLVEDVFATGRSVRIPGSTASTIGPARLRAYLGGPSLAIAVRTVFLEIAITRAIAAVLRIMRLEARPAHPY